MNQSVKALYRRMTTPILRRRLASRLLYQSPLAEDRFFERLISHTNNFGGVTWLGKPIWQNILDLWVIQETIAEVSPALLIECGTNRGGSAYFYAHLFDLLGTGRVISIDVERMHDITHPRVEFLIGSSVSEAIANQVREEAAKTSGPVMVILDSDHSEQHVSRELEVYAPLVTLDSYCLVQDGVIDTLDMFTAARPGPLGAINRFLANNRQFRVDVEKCNRFLVTHHPMGWLKRVA
jgi:cephalosporin hydroxylase